MKSTVEALQIKYKLLKNIEDALYSKDEKELQSLMTVVSRGRRPHWRGNEWRHCRYAEVCFAKRLS